MSLVALGFYLYDAAIIALVVALLIAMWRVVVR